MRHACLLTHVLLPSLCVLFLDFVVWELPDSNSYRYLANARTWSLSEILTNERTFPYPAFIAFCQSVTGNLKAVPYLQFVIHYLSLVFLIQQLKKSGLNTFVAAILLLSMTFSPIVMTSYQWIMTETLGLALVNVSLGSLLWAQRSKQPLAYVTLALSTLLAVAIKPVHSTWLASIAFFILFPIPHPAEAPDANEKLSFWKKLLLKRSEIIAVALPLLAFCSLRLVSVGSFAISSFEAIPLSGTAVQFYRPGDITPTDEGTKLFLEILEGRKREFTVINPYREKEGRLDHKLLRAQFHKCERTVAQRAAGQAARTLNIKDRGAWMNKTMSDFALRVLKKRTIEYVAYVKSNIRSTLEMISINQLGSLAIITLIGIFTLARRYPPPLLTRFSQTGKTSGAKTIEKSQKILLLLAVGLGIFSLLHVIVFCLMVFPTERYILYAMYPFPGLALSLAYNIWR